MAAQFTMNPERVAYFEAAGWRAYYDRKWFQLMRLLVALNQEEFHIPFPMSLLAAYSSQFRCLSSLERSLCLSQDNREFVAARRVIGQSLRG